MTQDSVWCVDLHTMILMGWRFAVSVECCVFVRLCFWWNEFEIGGSFVQFVRCFQVRVTIVYFRKRLLRKISLTSCTYDDVPLRHSHFSTPPNIHQKHKKRQQHLSLLLVVLAALYSQANTR